MRGTWAHTSGDLHDCRSGRRPDKAPGSYTFAAMDMRSAPESPEELQSLRARLYEAEEKLRALESSGGDADARRLSGAEAQSPAPDYQQEEFLVILAHEFRNPLAPIRTAVEIMQMIGQKDAALDKALDVISRQVDHLSRLVDNLLDISRITQEKTRFKKQRIDVNALLSGALEIALPLIDERRHRLIVAPPGEPASIEGDLPRLVQVIANLLDNAARYTEPGGEIRVSASTQDGLVVISVADNGAGISAELLPRIFAMFMQAERGLDRPQGGLGIGLSVVRTIVLMHGGTVEARSDGPESGSEFIVRLPLVQAAGLAESVSNHHGGRDMPRRIVVIDDNQDAAESIAMLLRLKATKCTLRTTG